TAGDHPYERDARVHARTEWEPGAVRLGVTGPEQQVLRCANGRRGVVGSGQEGHEEPDDLVTDELLDDSLVGEQDVRGCRVETLHEPGELHRAYPPGEVA